MLHYTKTLLHAATINIPNISAIQNSSLPKSTANKWLHKPRKFKNPDIFFTLSVGSFLLSLKKH